MSGRVRISGLIKIADTIRRELSQPMSAAERTRLRARVDQNLTQVHDILRDSAARIEHLPAPSQRAYRFLAGIDWSAPGVTTPAETPADRKTTMSWRGLSSFIDRILILLANDLEEAQLIQAGATISRMSRQMELTIQRDRVTPDRMSPATRAQRGWLAFLSQPENLSAYVAARKIAGRVIDAAAVGSRHYPPPVEIHFQPLPGIYKMRRTRDGTVLSFPTPMIAFDAPRFEALASLIYQRGSTMRQRAIEFMTGEDYQTLRAELESLGGVVEQTRGAAHDLAESFARVNHKYFGGKMPRPRLTWNRTFTGRKFGHFDYLQDTLMVTRTLDSPKVPEFVVDYLVFHELLHKFHGIHWVNGRGYAHTAEFYASERKFERFAEAEKILSALAREVR